MSSNLFVWVLWWAQKVQYATVWFKHCSHRKLYLVKNGDVHSVISFPLKNSISKIEKIGWLCMNMAVYVQLADFGSEVRGR